MRAICGAAAAAVVLAGCNPSAEAPSTASTSPASSASAPAPAATPVPAPALEPYSEQERAERTASFTAYDANGDSRLQRSELAAAVRAQASRMISRYDLDENGGLSRPELDNTRTPTEQLEELFLEDANRDGALTAQELEAGADAAFTRRDADRDNEQTLEEWLTRPARS